MKAGEAKQQRILRINKGAFSNAASGRETAAELFAAADSRPFAGPGAEAPRASQVKVAVWSAREGRDRLSERTLCRPEVHSEERSDEESLVQRSYGETIGANGASCSELAAVA